MSHQFNQYRQLLNQSFDHAVAYLESLPERPVDKHVTSDTLRQSIGGELPLTSSCP